MTPFRVTGSGEGGTGRYFVDVNGDNYLSPLDALMVINELNNRQNGAGEGESAPLESPSSSTLKTTLVEVPFTAKKRSSANASLVYGPMPSTEELEKAFSLDEYLAQQTGDEEEFDYLDGLATDILRK